MVSSIESAWVLDYVELSDVLSFHTPSLPPLTCAKVILTQLFCLLVTLCFLCVFSLEYSIPSFLTGQVLASRPLFQKQLYCPIFCSPHCHLSLSLKGLFLCFFFFFHSSVCLFVSVFPYHWPLVFIYIKSELNCLFTSTSVLIAHGLHSDLWDLCCTNKITE